MIIRCKSLDVAPLWRKTKCTYSKIESDAKIIHSYIENSPGSKILNTDSPLSISYDIVSYNSQLNLQEIEMNVNIVNQCEVCYENMYKLDTFSFECGHKFCFDCVKEYFTFCITEKHLDKLKCLHKNCPKVISNPKLLSFLDEKTLQKYLKFLKNDEITKDNNKIHCPYPDCDSYAYFNNNNTNNTNTTIFDLDNINRTPTVFASRILNPISNRNEKDFQCVTCENGHKFCTQCLSLNWHLGQECFSKEENEFFKYIQENGHDMKNCPLCGVWTDKTTGCNHMKCSSCRYQWCWVCKGEFVDNHYTDINSKCYGKMYEGYLNQNFANINLDDIQNIVLYPFNENFILRPLNRVQEVINYEEIGYGKFKFEIKNYTNFFQRFIIFLALMILITIGNIALLKYMINFIKEKNINIIENYTQSGKKCTLFLFRTLTFLIIFSIYIITMPLGVPLSLIIYTPSLFKYLFLSV